MYIKVELQHKSKDFHTNNMKIIIEHYLKTPRVMFSARTMLY
jgi:hypothetical protein